MQHGKINDAWALHKFFNDANKLISWMNDKSSDITVDNYGHDWETVQALHKKQADLEDDFSNIELQVKDLGRLSHTLAEQHPENETSIQKKYDILLTTWEQLKPIADDWREKVKLSFRFHQFLNNWRELMLWISDAKTMMTVDTLVQDTAGTEALVQRHNERKADIEAHEEAFTNCINEGQSLVDLDPSNKANIPEKLSELQRDRDDLMTLWDQRRVDFDRSLNAQQFYGGTEQLHAWVVRQRNLVENKDPGESLDSVERYIQKFDSFQNALSQKREHLDQLNDLGSKVVQADPDSAPRVEELLHSLNTSFNEIQDKAEDRRQQLDDSYKYHSFDVDADVIQSWIVEKLHTATDGTSHTDPTNLQTRLKKHQAVEDEAEGVKLRVEKLQANAADLIEAAHPHSETINSRLDRLNDSWNQLLDALEVKRNKLNQTYRQKQFISCAEEISNWFDLAEEQTDPKTLVETDLQSVITKKKQFLIINYEMKGNMEKIESLSDSLSVFQQEGIPEYPILEQKYTELFLRVSPLENAIANGNNKLEEAFDYCQLISDINEEEDWIGDRESIVMSKNVGKSMVIDMLIFLNILDQ